MKRIKEIFIIFTCLLMWAILLGGWSYTLKTSTPAGEDDPREADDRMREIKGAFVERLNVDHYFAASATSTYDAADTGKHRYITFREPNSIVSVDADEYILFTKDVNGIAEIHGIDENEAEFQLTSGGTINITSGDLLGTLANNTYFTAVDAAGTGTVDLIKADANDALVISDGSKTATNAAPTLSMGIVNKKYVDDQLNTKGFGAYTNEDDDNTAMLKAHAYLANQDGFVTAVLTGASGNHVNGYIGATSDPAGAGVLVGANTPWSAGTKTASICFPVASGKYFEVTIDGSGTVSIYWHPIGTLVKPTDQE